MPHQGWLEVIVLWNDTKLLFNFSVQFRQFRVLRMRFDLNVRNACDVCDSTNMIFFAL